MLDFSTLKTLTIPEGKATRISKGSEDIVWESPIASFLAEKITADTWYDSSTTYTDENFILISVNVAPKGTVYVNYAGYQKTCKNDTENETNFKVFFGTYQGVTDPISLPDSGILTIEGDYVRYGVGSYPYEKLKTTYCSCITAINSFGKITEIPSHAF